MDFGQSLVDLFAQPPPNMNIASRQDGPQASAPSLPGIEIPRGVNPVLYLLGSIANGIRCLIIRQDAILSELRRTRAVGANTPVSDYTIGTTAVVILERDTTSGAMYRKVQIWVDSDIGGPPVTLRVGPGISSIQDGLLLTPGQMNDLNEVSSNMEWHAVASSTIKIRVFEKRAA